MPDQSFESETPGHHVLSEVVVNDRREISRLADLVDRFGEDSGLSEDDTADVNLILDELVSNVIKYGYDDRLVHDIHVIVMVEGDQITMQIEDDGMPFNPFEAPAPNLEAPIEARPIGGLGVFIVKAMVESFTYQREGDHNILTMTRKTRG